MLHIAPGTEESSFTLSSVITPSRVSPHAVAMVVWKSYPARTHIFYLAYHCVTLVLRVHHYGGTGILSPISCVRYRGGGFVALMCHLPRGKPLFASFCGVNRVTSPVPWTRGGSSLSGSDAAPAYKNSRGNCPTVKHASSSSSFPP